jgi:hypothetical protein
MPLTKAQVEDFLHQFFRDHRLPAPPVRIRKKFMVTTAKRKCLNLPPVITRQALADQVAARLCRDVVRRLREKEGQKRPRLARHFGEWQKYVHGVVVHHFGKGDGLR